MSSSQDIDPRLRTLSVAAERVNVQPNPQSRPPSAANVPHQQHTGSPISPYPPLHNASPPNIHPAYYTNTPQSAEDVGDQYHGNNSPAGDPNDPKRPRACEACRGLKVKCEPDPTGEGPCKRCAKANRQCQITQPSRKRQKKTDTRVADLEKKIEILQRLTANINPRAAETAPLRHDGHPPHAQSPYLPPPQDNAYYSRPEHTGTSHQPAAAAGWSSYPRAAVPEDGQSNEVGPQKRKHESQDSSIPDSMASKANAARALLEQQANPWMETVDKSRLITPSYADVIDRGLLSVETAEQIFECYVDKMAPHLPAVVFHPDTTAASVRTSKPVLFLAILAVGSGPVCPEFQPRLAKEVMEVFANRILIRGEKSLELVQALQVSTFWYYPPEHFEELKFYQLVHIAAVMAIDIGMGKSSRTPNGKPPVSVGLFSNPSRKQPFPNPESVEARRAWLASYFLCCNTSMGLRRPNLIRWTPFMTDCLKVLETSTDAFPSDKTLCAWVRSQHIAEEVGYQFSMDDPSAKISIADDKVNYALKKFEQDLSTWRQEVPLDARSHSLEMTGHVVSLYMHEIALHVDHNIDDFKPPYHESTIAGLMTDVKPQALTTSHVEALSACLTAIDGVFEVFLKHSVEVVRCLPIANFVRVAYATVVLIKMSLAASNPDSGIGKIFVSSNLKAEEYLDGLIQLFTGAAADHKSQPSSKFLIVLVMLKTWFQRRLKCARNPNEGDSTESSTEAEASSEAQLQSPSRRQSTTQQKSAYIPTNTPLDVLSDVATSDSRSQSAQLNQYQPANDWQQPPLQHQFQSYPVNIMNQQGFNEAMNSVDANMNVIGTNYMMGDGLEQAMTLAGFGAYLGDDAFFANGGFEYNGL